MVEKPDYYSVGSGIDPVYSNSGGSALNPDEGGSPQKFVDFLNNNLERKESKGLYTGTTVHKFAEAPELFAVSEVEKPEGMLGKMTDALEKALNDSTNEMITGTSVAITSDLKSPSGQSAAILQTTASYEKLAALLDQGNVETMIRCFRYARAVTDSYTSYKEATLVDKFISEGVAYFKEIKKLDGKIRLTASEKRSIEGAIESLKLNAACSNLLNLKNSIFESGIQEWKELDIYFTVGGAKCKARIDRLEINHNKKTIKIIDLKTTGKSLYLFPEASELRRYYRQIAFYRAAVKRWIAMHSLQGKDNEQNSHFFDTLLQDYTIECYFVVVETTGYFLSAPYRVSDACMNKGLAECMSLVQRFVYHCNTGIWNKSMEEILNKGELILHEPKTTGVYAGE